MKQVCFSEEFGPSSIFSAGELALLREESYDLDDKGRVITKQSNLQILKNIKFTFEAFSKYFGAGFRLKLDDMGWESFLKAIKIRNRLMHPKSALDLNVSDEEFDIIRRANSWFESNINLALDSASDILENQTKLAKEATEKMNSFLSKVSGQQSNSLSSQESNDEL